jgi:hypothetical protein
MKNINKLTILALLSTIISCKNEAEKPKVSYNKTPKTIVKQADTTKILVADLPVQFEGTRYLIFPVGNLNITENGVSKYESTSREEEQSFTISNNMDTEITGFLQNLKFQKIDSDSLTVLSDKPILLESTTFLKDFAFKNKQQILVHLLEDNDSNDDGKLDTNDIKSLYLSDISGTKFTKISVDLQEVINWKIIETKNRLYFKSVEDSNKNGQFDKGDKLHYNFVNLLDKSWKAVE